MFTAESLVLFEASSFYFTIDAGPSLGIFRDILLLLRQGIGAAGGGRDSPLALMALGPAPLPISGIDWHGVGGGLLFFCP